MEALLENGGRLIDTASFYGTEKSVGEAVRNSNVPREEIFVTTKLYPNQFGNAAEAIDEEMETLDIEYIDLMLLHHPSRGDVEAYKALEQAVKDGKVIPLVCRRIRGISAASQYYARCCAECDTPILSGK